MPKRPPSSHPLRHLNAADLRGLAQLATQATASVARITEGVHQSVWRTLGAPGGDTPGQTRGLTGLVYQGVQGVTQLVGLGVDAALAAVQAALPAPDANRPPNPEREAVLAVLNGVMGDQLEASHNPLATRMGLRLNGQALNWLAPPAPGAVSGKVLMTLHGLCMNELQWQPPGQATHPSHAAALASALGYTAVDVRYNTGRHISENGRDLAAHLEQLLTHWPVPVQDITVLAHSMGGLVARSAVQAARELGLHWPDHLKHLVFLGTPHHGAPLEKAGNWVDVLLGSTPYTAPFAKLGQLRSAGITDLRYGHVQDADWQGHDRFARRPDTRHPLPLPEGVACYTVAASVAGARSPLAERLLGDGLVPLHSALGQHKAPRRRLIFAKPNCCTLYGMNHLQLLHDPRVTQQLLHWLTPGP